MSHSHEKMNSDYVWVRNHNSLDADVKLRTHGYHYIYDHVPNKKERVEMIYRSMGRAHDWELERFRAGKKFPDRGNKKRFIKNFFRFMKHPIGMLYWRTYKFRSGKGRAISTLMLFGFFFTILKYKKDTWDNARKNYYILRTSKNVESSGLARIGYYDQQNVRQMMPLNQMLYHDLPGKSIIVNPCRNQNYRKYFEMRKKYNIKTFL